MKKIFWDLVEKISNLINDAPETWSTFFRDKAIPQMEPIEELHNNIMFYLAVTLFAVSWTIISIIIIFVNKRSSNKYISDTNEFIWTFSPTFILVSIIIPLIRVLLSVDMIDPDIVIGEGDDGLHCPSHCPDFKPDFYPDFKPDHYPDSKPDNYSDIKTYEDVIINHSFMERVGDGHWYTTIPDMVQYAQIMEQHKGKPLWAVDITLNRHGPKTRLNLLTWYFHDNDPSAFYLYGPEFTPITDNFIHKAMTLPYKINQEKIPEGFYYYYNVPRR